MTEIVAQRETLRSDRLRCTSGPNRPAPRRALSGVRRAGGDRLDRLHGPRQFRDQHPGRREIRLWPALGRAARQRHRDAVPGAVGQARHRHRPQSRRAVPRAVSAAGRLGDVGRQRDRRDGDRSRRVPRRRDRARRCCSACRCWPAWSSPRDRDLRHLDVRTARLPADRADHRRPGRGDRRCVISSRCSSRRSTGARRRCIRCCRRCPTRRRCCSRSASSARRSCRTRSICIPA